METRPPSETIPEDNNQHDAAPTQPNKKSVEEATLEFERVLRIIVRLRAPDGCPWDLEQTAHSMRKFLVEEAFEAVGAIESGDVSHTREELGDVFLIALMVSYIEEQRNSFSVASVFSDLADKLIRRHPHIFGEQNNGIDTAAKVVSQWHAIKSEVEGKRKKESVVDSIKESYPPLERAYRIQKAVAKVGFDWPSIDGTLEKIVEEANEIRPLLESRSGDNGSNPTETDRLEHELGDLLFSVVNFCRKAGIDPSIALHRSNSEFLERFRGVQSSFRDEGVDITKDSVSLSELDARWNAVKNSRRSADAHTDTRI